MNFCLCNIKCISRQPLTHTHTHLQIYWYIFKVMYTRVFNTSIYESLIIQRVCNQCFITYIDIRYLFILMVFILLFGWWWEKYTEHMCVPYTCKHVTNMRIRATGTHTRVHAFTPAQTYIFTRCQWLSTKYVKRNGEEEKEKKMKRRENGASRIGWTATSKPK